MAEGKLITVLGQRGVGKTTLIKSITDLPFDKRYLPSNDLLVKSVMRSCGKERSLTFADVGGYMEDQLLTCDYMRRADLIIVVWQAQLMNSFDFALNIIKDIQRDDYGCPILLIETKCDLESSSFYIRQNVAGTQLVYTSALRNLGISQARDEILQLLFTDILEKRDDLQRNINKTLVESVEVFECDSGKAIEGNSSFVTPEFLLPEKSLATELKTRLTKTFSRIKTAFF